MLENRSLKGLDFRVRGFGVYKTTSWKPLVAGINAEMLIIL